MGLFRSEAIEPKPAFSEKAALTKNIVRKKVFTNFDTIEFLKN